MKQKKSLWWAMLICIAATMCVCICACSSDDPVPTPEPKPDPKDNGEVTFTVNLPTGGGSGTASSPVTVNKGEELNMAISQKSSYTDPDGSVFTCEPKANIKLSATLDTIVAKDLTELTKIKDESDIKNSSTGTSPVCNQTVQTFDIGGQNIVFDLSHEVYTYVNSTKEKIEMPYVKVNPANLGNAAATEETPEGRSTVAIRSVTVRPLAKSRATTVTDSTLYEVTARFNLDIESVNAKTDAKQTLEFAVTYVGVVETTTTLYDPVKELSYQWEVSGTNSSSSPFVKSYGRAMEILMNQTSSYTDEYGNKSTGSPKAKITVSVAQDTIWTTSLNGLEDLLDKTGSVSDTQTATQKFGTNQQDISFSWSYETAQELPYYALEPVSLKGVETKELGDKTIDGKEVSLYEVAATFSQKAIATNLDKENSEVEIEYVVNYVAAMEITLVNVKYEPYGLWVDSHDNLPLGYYPRVRRVRVYSNGTELSDIFADYGHTAGVFVTEVDDDRIFNHNNGRYIINVSKKTLFNMTDSTASCGFRTELPKEGKLYADSSSIQFPDPEKLWNVSTYTWDKKADYPDLETRFENNLPDDSRPSGWYYNGFTFKRTSFMFWQLSAYEEYRIGMIACTFILHDQCLVIDGKCISFESLRDFNYKYSIDSKDFSEDWGSGQIFTFTTSVKYLGKNFLATQIDTLYVAKPVL